MNRGLTNAIRYVMDEWIPAGIRDTKWFMYPFYYFAYRGKNLASVMDFKKNVHHFTPEAYAAFYKGLNTISRNRKTDLNQVSIDAILAALGDTKNLIDVGCGGAYLLKKIHEKHPHIALTGLDLKAPEDASFFDFVEGNVEHLPFEDKQFDTVVCCHTVEHLLKLNDCITELIRITKSKLIIVTPKQRYFYYTLDEHVNFFPYKEALTSCIPLANFTCENKGGDWVYIANL